VALQRRHVQRRLVREVPVQQLFGDPGAGSDLLQPRAAVAVLGEQGRGRVLDHAPALLGTQQSCGRDLLTPRAPDVPDGG
jgi:hypothetical protein